jgi:hypothetical protein
MMRRTMATTERREGVRALGGIAFIASGLFFFAKTLLESWCGEPPSGGVEILAWVQSNELALSLTNEVLFFAAMSMIPALVALYDHLASTHRAHAVAGVGIMATTIPVVAVLVIVHGRLVYPVFGIRVHTPDIAELVIATYIGGLHAVSLMHAAGTVAVSLAMRHVVGGRALASLGFVAAAFDVVAAYPDAVGPIPVLVASGFFTTWFIAVGLRLSRTSGTTDATSERNADAER